jgi:hypothetical protein
LEDFHLNVVKASIGKDETMDKMREPSIGGLTEHKAVDRVLDTRFRVFATPTV